MSPGRRREMVDREHPKLPIVRQCALLGVSRSSLYYRPKAVSEEDLSLMGEIDRQYLETPFYGSRRMKAWLERRGIQVSRKRVQRLMRIMGCGPSIGDLAPASRRWSTGSIPICWKRSELFGPTRRGPPTSPTCPWPGDSSAWWPSWTGTAGTWWPGDCPTPWSQLLRRCLEGGAGARPAGGLQHRPEPAPAKAGGSQFTSLGFTHVLQEHGVKISMDGKGRYTDNIFVERLWGTVKYRRCT